MNRISSVSGGSITAGVLGANRDSLDLDAANGVAGNFDSLVVQPIRKPARNTPDRNQRLY